METDKKMYQVKSKLWSPDMDVNAVYESTRFVSANCKEDVFKEVVNDISKNMELQNKAYEEKYHRRMDVSVDCKNKTISTLRWDYVKNRYDHVEISYDFSATEFSGSAEGSYNDANSQDL